MEKWRVRCKTPATEKTGTSKQAHCHESIQQCENEAIYHVPSFVKIYIHICNPVQRACGSISSHRVTQLVAGAVYYPGGWAYSVCSWLLALTCSAISDSVFRFLTICSS